VARPESVEIALIEHSLAALSDIQQRIGIIAARRRLCGADSRELDGIGDAAYRIFNYQEELRRLFSAVYQNGKHQ
jgi:hypothetical protein